jgi:hypothetical protein
LHVLIPQLLLCWWSASACAPLVVDQSAHAFLSKSFVGGHTK